MFIVLACSSEKEAELKEWEELVNETPKEALDKAEQLSLQFVHANKHAQMKFALLKNTEGQYFNIDDYKEKVKALQTDKDKNLCLLYATDAEEQHAYIAKARTKGYDVLLMDSPLTPHYVNLLERKIDKCRFVRVDSDTVEKLIPHEDTLPSKLTQEEQDKLKPIIEAEVNSQTFNVQLESMESDDVPMLITRNEFMRRYKEMSEMGGGGFYGEMPDSYNLVVNTNHPLVGQLLNESDTEKQKQLIHQLTDLALLSNGLLKGEALTAFIKRSVEMI